MLSDQLSFSQLFYRILLIRLWGDEPVAELAVALQSFAHSEPKQGHSVPSKCKKTKTIVIIDENPPKWKCANDLGRERNCANTVVDCSKTRPFSRSLSILVFSPSALLKPAQSSAKAPSSVFVRPFLVFIAMAYYQTAQPGYVVQGGVQPQPVYQQTTYGVPQQTMVVETTTMAAPPPQQVYIVQTTAESRPVVRKRQL